MRSEPRIAFVIDALPSLGGGERVLFTALEIFPSADVFTLVYRKDVFVRTPIAIRNIQTSWMDRIPFVHTNHRLLLPLMPFAIQQFDLREYDIVVSFSYAVAHGIQRFKDGRHVSYTFTPMRYAWMDLNINGTRGGRTALLNIFMKAFRAWDRRAASRVHQFAAISQAVSERIANAYLRDSRIIYPPVEVERFTPAPRRENYYITVTRLVPHKRVDLLVQAFSQLGLPLLVIGDGPALPRLMKIAKSNIRFLGYLPDEQVSELMGKARGFVCATEEDFGIAMVEAQAAGCPILAYGKGGALETVIEGRTGIFFSEQTVESLISAVQRFESVRSCFQIPEMLQNAHRFNRDRFVAEFKGFVQPS